MILPVPGKRCSQKAGVTRVNSFDACFSTLPLQKGRRLSIFEKKKLIHRNEFSIHISTATTKPLFHVGN